MCRAGPHAQLNTGNPPEKGMAGTLSGHKCIIILIQIPLKIKPFSGSAIEKQ
jgi:hypothetical protein